MIKICIVDPHEISRRGLALLLGEQEGFQVVGMYSCPESMQQHLGTQEFDVLITTPFPGDSHRQEVQQQIQFINALQKTICISLKGGRDYARVLSSQYPAIFWLDESVDILITMIRSVFYKQPIHLNATTLRHNKDIFPLSVTETNLTRILTRREMEILYFIYRQQPNNKIAKLLFISEATVETHRKNIIHKLGAYNTVGVIKYVVKNELFPD
jgi:DNA-binding NarL/FixJ family response regulator